MIEYDYPQAYAARGGGELGAVALPSYLVLHWPTLLGVLTITRIPISNHKFATLLDYGGVLHLQMLQTFSLIQH